jgi:ankyrin repeat protein
MAACHEELEHEVRSLLQRRPTLLQLVDRTGKHAVHYCAENQQTVCIEQLLAAVQASGHHHCESILNLRDNVDGHTVLHLAVISGNLAMVKYLIRAGADVNLLDNEDHSAVHWAVVCGQPRIVDLLCAAGAVADRPDCHGAHPVHYAVQGCSPALDPSTVRYLDLISLQLFCNIFFNYENT